MALFWHASQRERYGRYSSRQRPYYAASSIRVPSVERDDQHPRSTVRLEPNDRCQVEVSHDDSGAPMGPRTPKSTVLTPVEEAMMRGRLRSWRAAMRCGGGTPLMSRSMANSASMRVTASMAIGACLSCTNS